MLQVIIGAGDKICWQMLRHYWATQLTTSYMTKARHTVSS